MSLLKGKEEVQGPEETQPQNVRLFWSTHFTENQTCLIALEQVEFLSLISDHRGSTKERGRGGTPLWPLLFSNTLVLCVLAKLLGTSLVAQTVKHLPTMRDTWVQSLGWEDLLEKGVVTHSSILAWKIPWMVEPGRLQSMGSQRVGHDWATSLSL